MSVAEPHLPEPPEPSEPSEPPESPEPVPPVVAASRPAASGPTGSVPPAGPAGAKVLRVPPPPPRPVAPAGAAPRPGVVVGKVVDVVVTSVGDREVEVRLADGRTGVADRREFDRAPSVGESVPAALLARDDPRGRVVLSHGWARKQRAWESVERARAEGTPVTGTVTAVVKGGATVDVGLRAFLPSSMVGEQPGADAAALVGTEVEVVVVEVDRAKDRLVVSRRDLLRRRRRQEEREAWSALSVGAVVDGTVVGLADYGAVVDLGGVRGLVHRSELTWGHLGDVADVVAVGEVVRVKVLDLNRSKRRVSLSLRRTSADPLDGLEAGGVHDGTVTRVVEYGCFVRLGDDGPEGLVHQSELTDVPGYRPDQLVSPGEVVRVKVLDVNRSKRRVSLSVRQVLVED